MNQTLCMTHGYWSFCQCAGTEQHRASEQDGERHRSDRFYHWTIISYTQLMKFLARCFLARRTIARITGFGTWKPLGFFKPAIEVSNPQVDGLIFAVTIPPAGRNPVPSPRSIRRGPHHNAPRGYADCGCSPRER